MSAFRKKLRVVFNKGAVIGDDEKADTLARDKQIAMTKFRRLAKGFVPDWGDDLQHKGYILYDHQNALWVSDCFYATQTQTPGIVYFATRQDALDAITAMGDDMELLK